MVMAAGHTTLQTIHRMHLNKNTSNQLNMDERDREKEETGLTNKVHEKCWKNETNKRQEQRNR